LLCLLTLAVLGGRAIVGVTAAEDPGSVDTAATLTDGSERAKAPRSLSSSREPEQSSADDSGTGFGILVAALALLTAALGGLKRRPPQK